MKRRQLLQRAATGLALVAGPQVIDMGSSSGSSQDATTPLNELLSVVSLSHVNDPASTPIFFPAIPSSLSTRRQPLPTTATTSSTSRKVNTRVRIGAHPRTSRKVDSPPTNSIRPTSSYPQ